MDFRPVVVLLVATLITACASTPSQVNHDFPELKEIKPAPVEMQSQEVVETLSAIKKPEEVERKEVREKIIIEKRYVNKSITDFNLNYRQKHFKFWVNFFSKRDSDRFKRFLKNGRTYEEIVERIFKEEGLPTELFYVGLIESGFQSRARSHAGAVGYWQFIKGTAKRYGLRVDRQVDERKSIYKSTRAAARYFKDLYNIFGSWELALCAYNAGEYRVIRAIRKGNTRDFRALVKKKLLPKETINYVPKMAAAKYLASKKEFKVKKPAIAAQYENAKELVLNRSFSLKSFAKQSGISKRTLKKFNPDIRWDWVKIGRRSFTAYVPENLHEKALAYSKTRMSKRSFERVTKKFGQGYRVRRGDNLTSIARKFGLSVWNLRKINKLRGSKIYPGQKLVVSSAEKKIYVVRRGDNLYRIAKRFGTSIREILSLNNLKKKTIYPSQKLWVPSTRI